MEEQSNPTQRSWQETPHQQRHSGRRGATVSRGRLFGRIGR